MSKQDRTPMRITIGIDLSLTGTGLCGFDGQTHAMRTIKTKPKDFNNIYDRVDHIVRSISEMIPDESALICIESPFVRVMGGGIDSSSKNLIALAHMMRRTLTRRELPFVEVAATQLKKFATGKGRCEKDMVIKEIYKRWGIDAADNNQADAAVLARIALEISNRRDGIESDMTKAQAEVVEKIMGGK